MYVHGKTKSCFASESLFCISKHRPCVETQLNHLPRSDGIGEMTMNSEYSSETSESPTRAVTAHFRPIQFYPILSYPIRMNSQSTREGKKTNVFCSNTFFFCFYSHFLFHSQVLVLRQIYILGLVSVSCVNPSSCFLSTTAHSLSSCLTVLSGVAGLFS